MEIVVVSGVGRGPTTLAAFDSALHHAGISNFNLIKLSSVVPLGWDVREVEKYVPESDSWGAKLYVVLAEARTNRMPATIGAGVGWYVGPDGKGLFVEHASECDGLDETTMDALINSELEKTMRGLCATRGWRFDGACFQAKLVSASVTDAPASVLVAGVYESARFG
jgi:arginine decarboxylase